MYQRRHAQSAEAAWKLHVTPIQTVLASARSCRGLPLPFDTDLLIMSHWAQRRQVRKVVVRVCRAEREDVHT